MSSNKTNKRGYSNGQPPLNLSEAQIRYAMENTSSNVAAAKWLNVHYFTYRKYAKMYIDRTTGKNLFDLHLSEIARKAWVSKCTPKSNKPEDLLRVMKPKTKLPLEDIFAGKHPTYDRKKLAKRMIHEGMLPECCDYCGYNTRRDFDLEMPLKLWYRDGDQNNLNKNNIRLLCFNCYFIISHMSGSARIPELRKDLIDKKIFG